jgi:hypothetical protein
LLFTFAKDAAAAALLVGDEGKRREDVHDASVPGPWRLDTCLARGNPPRSKNRESCCIDLAEGPYNAKHAEAVAEGEE